MIVVVVVVVVRFVNEKRARNEQRKERRERERMRMPAGGRADGQRAERAVAAAICASEGGRERERTPAERRLFVFLY